MLYTHQRDSKSEVELFVTIVNVLQPLTAITKSSTLDAAAALDLPIHISESIYRLQMRPVMLSPLETLLGRRIALPLLFYSVMQYM